MTIHLKITGILLILLALIHFFFPRYFKWKQEFGSLSTFNRQMMYVHTFFITLMIFLMGLLCLTSPIDLLTTSLGKQICLGLGIFWLARLIIQFFGYSSTLWKRKRFETSVHILFSILWTYFTAVFIWIYFR